MKGKREFNESQRNELIQNADKGKDQAEHFYDMLSGWAVKYKKYDSAGLAGKAKSYFEGLDSALEKGKDDIDKIFTAAEEVENEYAEKLEDVAFEMGLYADRINALLSVLQPVVPLASGTNPFAAPDFGQRLEAAKQGMLEKEILALIANPDKLEHWDIANRDTQVYIDFISAKYRGQEMFDSTNPNAISDVERDLLVKCYEYLYPENAKTMNGFLNPVIQDGTHNADVQNIKFLSYAAAEPYRTILFQYLPQITIADYNCSPPQHYAPSTHEIFVDLDPSNKSGLTDSCGAYFIFFHELGHGIDNAINGFKGNASDALLGNIESDVYDSILSAIKAQFPPTPTNEQINQMTLVLDSLKYGGPTLTDPALIVIRNDVVKEFQTNLSTSKINGVASDVYGGVTDNSITDFYGHSTPNYWYDATGSATGAQNREFFAGNFATNITGYQMPSQSANLYFPTATKVMDNIMKNETSKLK